MRTQSDQRLLVAYAQSLASHSADQVKPKKVVQHISSLGDLPYVKMPSKEELRLTAAANKDSKFKQIIESYKVIMMEKATSTLFFQDFTKPGQTIVYRQERL